jgi:hypothetical protein
MKAQKYEDVQYIISQDGDGEPNLNLVWKDGSLFLSLSGLFISDGDTWYELPVKDLVNVNVINEEPLQLRFKIPALDVVVTGKRAERLLALRHFLLPYIKREKDGSGMKGLVKFWAVGIMEIDILARLMGEEEAGVVQMMQEAKRGGLISEDGRVTEKGLALLSANERTVLKGSLR